jgi:hypothetical protein
VVIGIKNWRSELKTAKESILTVFFKSFSNCLKLFENLNKQLLDKIKK